MDSSDETIKIYELNVHKKIKPISIHDIKQGGGKYCLVGRPSAGKSTLIKSLMYLKSGIIPTCMVFSGSEEISHHYSDFVPQTFIHDELNKKNIEPIRNFMKRQLYAREFLKNPWCMLIFDDCFSSSEFLYTTEMQKYYKNGRHYSNMSIIASQYLMDIKSNVRSCFDGIFILAEPSLVNREKLWKNFGSVVPTLHQFNILMDALTQNYSAMYIDCRANTSNLSECIFWYKADINQIPRNWRFGADIIWNFAKQRCKYEQIEPENENNNESKIDENFIE